MLEWKDKPGHPMYEAKSPAAPGGAFIVAYDDVMYWDSFSGLSPTQDLGAIEKIAQDVHDKYMSTSND